MSDGSPPPHGPVQRFSPSELAVPVECVPADQVVSGDPEAGWMLLGSVSGMETGVWEHTVGVSTDVEEDEIFVVLSGRATVMVGGESIVFGPGDVGILAAGAETTWTVHETLRKVFVALPEVGSTDG